MFHSETQSFFDPKYALQTAKFCSSEKGMIITFKMMTLLPPIDKDIIKVYLSMLPAPDGASAETRSFL
jgi:hypothetical protein